jgi:F0F1-type ATP synthase membrane subunit b/b'
MSQWSVFGVDITPKFTDDIKNVLKVTSKKEIFFDVFECMYNGKTIIVEKVGTSDGLPVVSFEAVKNNKKYKCEALLVESEESELFLNENHLQFLKSIQKTPIKTIIEEKVEKVIPTNTVYEDKVRDVSEKIIKESQEKAQKLYDNKLKEYKKHKQLIAKQAEEYLNEKTESIRQELYEQYIDFLSSNDKKVNNLVKSNIDDITLSIDENNKEILSKVDKLSNLNKEELAKILSENIININNNLDSKVKDLNDQLDIILHDSNTKLNKLDEKTSRLLEKNIKHTDEIVKNITSKIEQVDEKIEDYKIDTFKHVVEKVADNKTEIEASLKNTISKINEQVDIKRDEVEKILAAELSNINEKLNIFSEEEDKKYKQLLENLNNLNKGEVKEILSEKINDKQLNSLKLDISKQFQNEMMSIKRLIEMSSGGGSVAKQFANGGTMDGSLNVTQNILSGGTNLLDIFNTDTSINLQDVTDVGNTTTNSISSSGTIFGDIGSFTTLNALTANFTQTIVSTTSALSVINDGTGPALYVQQSGNEPVATFVDREGGTVIIDDGGNVGIGTAIPTSPLDVVGNIAVTGTVDGRDIAADGIAIDNLESDVTFLSGEIDNIDLQQVTDVGNTTTNSLSVASLTATGKIIGGNNNTANGNNAAVLGGTCNTASGGYSSVGSGYNNNACAVHSGILGGSLNTVLSVHTCSFIIGSNLTSNAACTTFVNNLSSQGNIYANNVGIGTDSPDNKLTVDGDVDVTGFLSVGDTSNTFLTEFGSREAKLYVDGGDDYTIFVNRSNDVANSSGFLAYGRKRVGGVAVQDGDSLGRNIAFAWDGDEFLSTAQMDFVVDGTVSDGSAPTAITFSTGSKNADREERFRIDSSGNVGIGTDSPDSLLHVDGASGSPSTANSLITLRDSTSNIGFQMGAESGRGWIRSVDVGNQFLQYGILSLGEDYVSLGDGNEPNQFYIDTTSGNVGIGTDSPSTKLDVNGDANIDTSLTVGTSLDVGGHFSAATKSFLIDNPNGGKLQYGVIEGREHAVYYRGKTTDSTIKLPEEWEWLVNEDSVTVTVTPIGKFQPLYVISQSNNEVKVGGVEGEYNYIIYGTRKDVEPLEVNV